VQDAHEAIRRTDVARTPESVKNFLTPDQLKLYRLIWQRYTASQMSPARFAQTRADIAGGDYLFRAAGSVLVFDGFYRVWERDSDNDEEKELPLLTVGEALNLRELKPEQHFTQPPPRYSEASLIKALEEVGVGRPSTFAPTIDVIQTRHYVQQEERRLRPTDLGKTVNSWLIEHFPDIVDAGFTAEDGGGARRRRRGAPPVGPDRPRVLQALPQNPDQSRSDGARQGPDAGDR